VKERRLDRNVSKERQEMTFQCCTERIRKIRRQVKGKRKKGRKRKTARTKERWNTRSRPKG
jgi:hypothetical protein